MTVINQLVFRIVNMIMVPILFIIVHLMPKKRRLLIWGPTPIINNKYWSNAMKEAGYESQTLMASYYGTINQQDDFDRYFSDFVPEWLRPQLLKRALKPYLVFIYILRNAAVVHFPFEGGPLGGLSVWRMEAVLLRKAGIKMILIPYGGDQYMYSQVIDPSLRNGLLLSYPGGAKKEPKIKDRIDYWNKHADITLQGFMIDGIGRWDVTLPSILAIDVAMWTAKKEYSKADGINGPVKIIHTPNHRGFKGTEYLIHYVNELREEGLQIELILLEKVPNHRVKELMQQADILAEQFVFTGYAMSALEGMASGLPVMSNLEYEAYTRVFRRYSYLNECPILSTSPENMKTNLRTLIGNPELRMELGKAGREYAEKYHSYRAAQYLFGSIYDKILHGKDVDLMNLFHPLKSAYNLSTGNIVHPLFENRIQTHLPSKAGEL